MPSSASDDYCPRHLTNDIRISGKHSKVFLAILRHDSGIGGGTFPVWIGW
jgi:hypothetical protein